MILTKKLTQKQKAEILREIFGYYYEGDVLLDRYGNLVDFFRLRDDQFDTLSGIFDHHRYVFRKKGEEDAKQIIRKSLGI